MTKNTYCLSTAARRVSCFVLAVHFCLSFSLYSSSAATWSVAARNAVVLDTSGVGATVGELSGVTYLGPSPAGGKHRFLTVQDNGNGIVTLDATFDLSGNLVSAGAVSSQSLSMSQDFEGIAQVGSSVFLSEETGPGVREYNPTTGNELQNVSIPTLFTSNRRSNLGFESLSYDAHGSRLWTATEAALTVDGGVATATAGTTVRLLELNRSGNEFLPGSQYAYEVEPIHGTASGSAQTGLVDLVTLPDGTLLGLERSLAGAIPPYNSKLFEIDFSAATDVSVAPYDAGLSGAIFAKVSKSLLWTGPAGGGFGQNLEGLTVGPRLPNGDWILLGVVDDGDVLSSNTIVALTATPAVSIPFDLDTGDFDQDTDSDGADFLAWQRGFGVATLAGITDGDGNHDGTVTGSDLAIWESQYGAATLLAALHAVPEPASLALLLIAGASGLAVSRGK